MNRLVQGDVGSGKTLVAAACCRLAQLNGAQSAVMAPTEILAEQHYETMRGFLEPCGATVALLKGSSTAKEKRIIREGLLSGEIGCCVGTHALLSEGVAFRRLGLVVTDEQHRFGVEQRTRLSKENADAHVLVMSATPIPRTLALIIYGDLKLSVLDELPPGRKSIETLLIHSSKRRRALGFVRDALDQGRQVYLVCPLIEQGEAESPLLPAIEYEKALRENELKGCAVALLHGKMKPREKESVMRGFKRGEIQALVATTVVEVGVDVPNATIMMIENAERFGLSQLHQLRGRVGRGGEKSWCILVSDSKSGPTRERLGVMRETSDGFEVAERDLKLRGPGDFFGSRQHGLPALKLADLAKDLAATQAALDCAKDVLAEDPELSYPEHAPLAGAVAKMMASVGDRPN
jgi:ATP-dependent DNA helicase RecG